MYFVTGLGLCKTTLYTCSVGIISCIFLWIKYYFYLCIKNEFHRHVLLKEQDIWTKQTSFIGKIAVNKVKGYCILHKNGYILHFSHTNQFATGQYLWKILNVSSKHYFRTFTLLKRIFRATDTWKIARFGIFLKLTSLLQGSIYEKILNVSCKKRNIFGFFFLFLRPRKPT